MAIDLIAHKNIQAWLIEAARKPPSGVQARPMATRKKGEARAGLTDTFTSDK